MVNHAHTAHICPETVYCAYSGMGAPSCHLAALCFMPMPHDRHQRCTRCSAVLDAYAYMQLNSTAQTHWYNFTQLVQFHQSGDINSNVRHASWEPAGRKHAVLGAVARDGPALEEISRAPTSQKRYSLLHQCRTLLLTTKDRDTFFCKFAPKQLWASLRPRFL